MLTINKRIAVAGLLLYSAGTTLASTQLPDQGASSSTARPATNEDMAEIIKLVGAGFSDQLVIQQVKSEGKVLLFSADQLNTFVRSGIDGKLVAALETMSTVTQESVLPSALPATTAQVPVVTVAVAARVAVDAVPRVFLQSASNGPNRNAWRDQSAEMAKDFEKNCPSVQVTINQARANYTVTLNHIEAGLLIRDNQFEVYDADGDRMKGKEGGSINKGVKGVCALIAADWTTKTRALLPGP
jgi:hypothetical protein